MILEKIKILIKLFILMIVSSGCKFSGHKTLEANKLKKEMLVGEKKREYIVYLPKKAKKLKQVKTLFFFHGLAKSGEESFQFLQILKVVKNLDSLIVVFPLGLEGAFSSHSDMLGWTPGYFADNKLFFKKIIANLEKEYGINTTNVIAGGFSNGAYFLSQILQSKDAEIFSGFWLQGGGNAYILEPNLVKRKVFLEVGCLDTGNVESVRKLKSHLLQHGWKENENLFYTEFNKDHQLHINNIEKILMVLENNK